MLKAKRLTLLFALSFVSVGFVFSGDVHAEDVAASVGIDLNDPESQLYFFERHRQFQLAFVSRAASDRVTDDGTEEIILGVAESLQHPKAGKIIGKFQERILYTDPATDFAPEGYPDGSFIVKIVDTVSTRAGDLNYEAIVAGVPGADGDFLTTALSGTITGGTGAFRNARGDVTLAGKVSHCDLTLGELGCAESDFVEFPEGLNYECHFILRGTL